MEPRYDVQGRAQVFTLAPTRAFIGEASLRNMSRSGVCISMETRLQNGDLVHLVGPGLGIDAIVRHSAAGTSGFVIGLEVIGPKSQEDRNILGLPAAW
jgi:hypothetical protein